MAPEPVPLRADIFCTTRAPPSAAAVGVVVVVAAALSAAEGAALVAAVVAEGMLRGRGRALPIAVADGVDADGVSSHTVADSRVKRELTCAM
jgi:hypothetical protein